VFFFFQKKKQKALFSAEVMGTYARANIFHSLAKNNTRTFFRPHRANAFGSFLEKNSIIVSLALAGRLDTLYCRVVRVTRILTHALTICV
jgi:hypothetical protein